MKSNVFLNPYIREVINVIRGMTMSKINMPLPVSLISIGTIKNAMRIMK